MERVGPLSPNFYNPAAREHHTMRICSRAKYTAVKKFPW